MRLPLPETVETAYDYLDRSRAVNVFLNSIPALSINALREGQANAGCATSNQVCIFGVNDIDARTLWHYQAIVVSPNLISTTPGAGTAYLGAFRDNQGRYLDGSKTYKLNKTFQSNSIADQCSTPIQLFAHLRR